jgi:hypothetical protein
MRVDIQYFWNGPIAETLRLFVKFAFLLNRGFPTFIIPPLLECRKSRIFLAGRANDDVADMHMGWLIDNVQDGIGHIGACQQRPECVFEMLHHIVIISRGTLKSAQHDTRLNQRDTDSLGPDFTPQPLRQRVHGKLGSPIHRAER